MTMSTSSVPLEDAPLPVSVRGRTFVDQVKLPDGDVWVVYTNARGKRLMCTPAEWNEWCGERGVERPPVGAMVTVPDGRLVLVTDVKDEGVELMAGRPKLVSWDRWGRMTRAAVMASR